MTSAIALVPLGMKWEIERKVLIPSAFVIGLMSAAVAASIKMFRSLTYVDVVFVELFLKACISASLLLWRFYRDPEREPPGDGNAVLSPADGRIIYINKVEDGEVPSSEKGGRRFPLDNFVQSDAFPKRGTLIGIAMNFLDVHVNRAPIDGRVSLLHHIKGSFISLKKKEAALQNERVCMIIDNGYVRVGIIQIASRLVRRIVTYIREGSEVRRGQRIGMIRFGSQVDVYLPDLPSLRIRVAPGEKVHAGVSIVATLDTNDIHSPGSCHGVQ